MSALPETSDQGGDEEKRMTAESQAAVTSTAVTPDQKELPPLSQSAGSVNNDAPTSPTGAAATKTCTCGANGQGGGTMNRPAYDFGDTLPTNLLSHLLSPTMTAATTASKNFGSRAFLLNWALNIAIALQVLLGALITALSAVVTSGSGTAFSIGTLVLGTASTAVAGYVARARGTGEPDLSVKRQGDIDKFLRKCQAMIYDYEYDTKILRLDPNKLYDLDLLTSVQSIRNEYDVLAASWTTNNSATGAISPA